MKQKLVVWIAAGLLVALTLLLFVIAREGTRPVDRPPPRPPVTRAPVVERQGDPGPHRTDVEWSHDVEPSGEGGGGGGSGATKHVTAAQVRAQFAGLAAQIAAAQETAEAGEPTPEEDADCRDVIATLDLVREGSRQLHGRRMGGRSRAENLALCRALPREVRACLTPTHHAAHADECRTALERFAGTRNDPRWVERLSGDPPSERPEPPMTEAEARALNARRRSR